MKERELCPVCGIHASELQNHLEEHSKEEIIMAYSCKTEPATPTCSNTPMNETPATSGIRSPIPNCNERTPSTTFNPTPNAYNTVLIPMNAPNCGMQQLSQPALSFAMQQKPPHRNAQFANILPVQNPLICMPQNIYPNFLQPNVASFQAACKEGPVQVNLASQGLNAVEQTLPMSSSTKVIQPHNFVANTTFPNMQQGPYQALQVLPFYSSPLPPSVPNYSYFGNNIYAPPVMPVVQFPGGYNAVSPLTHSGLYPGAVPTNPNNFEIRNQSVNVAPSFISNEPMSASENSDQTENETRSEIPDQIKRCYYVGDKEALVSIGDDVKLILPKDILSKEDVLGGFLREQLASAIASEVKSDPLEDAALEQNEVQNLSPKYCSSPVGENLFSSSKVEGFLNKPKKYETSDETSTSSIKLALDANKFNQNDICTSTPIISRGDDGKTGTFVIKAENSHLELFADEQVLGVAEEVYSADGQQIDHGFSAESSPDIEMQTPRVLKMFSNSVRPTCSKFDEDDFASGRSINCISQSPDRTLVNQDKSVISTGVSILDLTSDGKCDIFKIENYDNDQEEKLSLKASETLEHSDSESPCLMENTLQDLICIDEPPIQSMSSPRKVACSEFSISNAADHSTIDLPLDDKEDTVFITDATFIPSFLSPAKSDCPDDIVESFFKKEKKIEVDHTPEEFFLEPFASTSGVQKKQSVLNKSLDQEEYDFDYESDYFDSDSEISQSHKQGLLFQLKCSKCHKSCKSLKEKLLHSGCHADDTGKETLPERLPPLKTEVDENNSKEPINLKNELVLDCETSQTTGDDVLKQRIELLRNPLACSLCFSLFPDSLTTSLHMKTHSLDELKCTTCNKQIKSFYKWTDHQLFHYGASKHECKYCGKKFERRPLLNIHVRKHTGLRPHKCQTCNKKFAVWGTLKAHMITHLKNQDVECDYCNKKFNNFSGMLRHKIRFHLSKKRKTFKKKQDYLCSTCNAVFQTERKLLWHQETHKRWPSKCKYCGECFVHQSGLTKHIRLKHNDKHVPEGEREGVSMGCPICSKMYTFSSLGMHMRTHNGYKPYKCIVCGKQFSVKCNLTNHMWVHAGTKDRPYRCNLCEKSYARKKFLEAHIRTHKKIKPYTCNECGKAFAYKYNLNTHLKEHFGEKEHLCSYCGKAFFRKYNLKDHVRIHTGETPFSCTICNKEFTQKSNYNVHIKAFHVERHVLDEEV